MSVEPNLYIGMLSGTSRDGVDTVLVRFGPEKPEVLESLCVAYPPELAQSLRQLIERRHRPANDEMQSTDRELAEFFSLVAWDLLNRAGVSPGEVTAIGSHGQTVWHNPTRLNPETLQLGDPQRIADLSGIKTVGNFRQADLRAGGQGAPLAPLLHKALLKPEEGVRAVLNIGGIANISLIEASGKVSGYDTGPGNCLLDGWIHEHHAKNYDASGAWAEGGSVDRKLLDLLLDDPYFTMPAPKSTGVEYFNLHWLQNRLAEVARETKPAMPTENLPQSPQDIQATLSEFTALTVAEAVLNSAAKDLLICGGGMHNSDLINRLRRLLPHTPISSTVEHGIEPDLMEGILFAWLARERLATRKLDTRLITGAKEPVMLGDVFVPAQEAVTS